MEYQVTAVVRSEEVLDHTGIMAIGNHLDRWSISAESAIRRLALKRDAFYVIDAITDARVYLTIMQDHNGQIMLRTTDCGRVTNHLLGLRTLRDCGQID